MDLSSSAQEAPNDFNANDMHDAPENIAEYAYGKSSHAFRTISEVSDELDVPQHVLRFWESKFAQIRPLKRGGGRRYYRPEDIELLKRIKNYLYKQGYTIKGVQRLLKEKRQEAVASFIPYANPTASIPSVMQGFALREAPTVASYLQAAAAAPSALAMAYGSMGAQIGDGQIAKAGQQHFSDAFEQSTVKIAPEVNTANDQMEKSLFAVTQIHEEIATQIQPIRITNPAAPRLEDMANDVVSTATEFLEPKALEFSFETPAADAAGDAVVASAAQAVPADADPFSDDAFNQDIVDEELPVKRLDAEEGAAEITEEVVLQNTQAVVAPEFAVAPIPEPIQERIIERIIEVKTVEVKTVYVEQPPAPAIAPDKKEQLLDILAEMMQLRDLLHAGTHA